MTKTDWNPTRDYMIVEPDRVPEKTAGGIVIPDQSRRSLNEGTIIKLGPECNEHAHKVGDRIVFSESSEFKIKQDDDSIIVVVQEVNILLCKPAKPRLFTTTPKPSRFICDFHEYNGEEKCPACEAITRPAV